MDLLEYQANSILPDLASRSRRAQWPKAPSRQSQPQIHLVTR